jgi:hypothetical protein
LISTSKCVQTVPESTHESKSGRTCAQNTSRKLNSPVHEPSWEVNSGTIIPVHAIITILRHTDIYSPLNKLFLNISFHIIPPLTVPIHTKSQNSRCYTIRFIPSCYIFRPVTLTIIRDRQNTCTKGRMLYRKSPLYNRSLTNNYLSTLSELCSIFRLLLTYSGYTREIRLRRKCHGLKPIGLVPL